MTRLPAPAELEGDTYDLGFNSTDHYTMEVTGHDGGYGAFATIYEDFTFHVPREYELEHDDAIEYVQERAHIVDAFLEENFNVDIIDGSDIHQLEFYADGVELDPESATEEDAVEAIWEHSDLVRFLNEMDPGTFNTPYTGRLLTEAFLAHDEANDSIPEKAPSAA